VTSFGISVHDDATLLDVSVQRTSQPSHLVKLESLDGKQE
jgi:hypothetical protein